jgi:hypothetical protein
MTHAHPHHQHNPGHAHPPARATLSLIRLSVAQRLALAGAPIALIWLAVFWAMR